MSKLRLTEILEEAIKIDAEQKPVKDSDVKRWAMLVQSVTAKYFAKHLQNLTPPTFNVTKGGRYYKIIQVDSEGTSRSVHSFVEKETGLIYKPASWRAPAKHARGSVWSPDGGRGCMNDHGFVHYLR